MAAFEHVYIAASSVLPNNNILNIISKARQEPYKGYVLEMFRTDEPVAFKKVDPSTGNGQVSTPILFRNRIDKCRDRR
jgi:hypothetical protein